ncbi:MAG: IS5 family transposase [Candidatus Velthaea sp.]
MFRRRHVCLGEKRGDCVGKTKRGKGTKIMAIADGAGLPLAVCIRSASPHEVTLVHETLAARFIDDVPERLIGDRAYDSDRLRFELSDDGIDLIAPHRSNRTRPKRQDGRALRRYRRRWKVERLFAWLHNFRRLVVRYERHAENFLGMVQLGCIRILLRQQPFMR